MKKEHLVSEKALAQKTETSPTAVSAADARRLDLMTNSALARMSMSLSPQTSLLAVMDWASHLATSPGRQMQLLQYAVALYGQYMGYLRRMAAGGVFRPSVVEKPVQDRRFADPAWQQWPFNAMAQAFLLQEKWWDEATQHVFGVSKHNEELMRFGTKQVLDMFSPGNVPFFNPVVLQNTWQEGGANIARGLHYLMDDTRRKMSGEPPEGTEKYIPGRDVAVTPGKVVLRNRLMELIQYSPTTAKVRPEPVLIVPAWIMKYYILDLSPDNSMVKYLVDQGHTVFSISWKNPDENDRDLTMGDYLHQGFIAALDAINAIVPDQPIHATGYCLGGTLLSIGAATLAREGQLSRLASMTMFASQTDFSEPGELSLFIDEGQLAMLESQMESKGFLKAEQMSGAFQLLRSWDLVWSPLINDYMLGTRRPLNDLMAWNADSTRMPAKMHIHYLRSMYLNNDLSQDRYLVDGRPITLNSLRLPIFCVGTAADHVAPWRSVYKLHNFTPAELTFVLTSGGHNAGIVTEPGHPRRHYQMLVREAGGVTLPPEEWLESAPRSEGSWWVAWNNWLNAHSGKAVQPPEMGAANYPIVCDAPGEYVLLR